MITVKATREGLIGGKTWSGYRVEGMVPFVALPSTAAMRLWVKLYNPLNSRSCRAVVLDVGPWNEKDHPYVFQPMTTGHDGVPQLFEPGVSLQALLAEQQQKWCRPQAESGIDSFGRKTNGAGIDLGEAVWDLLDMKDNSLICWEFD